jgi:hypothetical protein
VDADRLAQRIVSTLNRSLLKGEPETAVLVQNGVSVTVVRWDGYEWKIQRTIRCTPDRLSDRFDLSDTEETG